jgi:hypothetical protein
MLPVGQIRSDEAIAGERFEAETPAPVSMSETSEAG